MKRTLFVFTLALGAMITGGCASYAVHGSVRDKATGNPISGAGVTLGEKNATTGAAGAYELKDVKLAPNSTMIVNAPGYFLLKEPIARQAHEGHELTRNVELEEGCSCAIHGIVRDKATGNPIAGAGITVGEKNATTGATGEYDLGDVHLTQLTGLLVNAPGYFLYNESVGWQAHEGQAIARDVELTRRPETSKPLLRQ